MFINNRRSIIFYRFLPSPKNVISRNCILNSPKQILSESVRETTKIHSLFQFTPFNLLLSNAKLPPPPSSDKIRNSISLSIFFNRKDQVSLIEIISPDVEPKDYIHTRSQPFKLYICIYKLFQITLSGLVNIKWWGRGCNESQNKSESGPSLPQKYVN